MKKIYLFLIAMVMVASVFAQKPEIVVKATAAAPEIDAVADDLWDAFDATPIEGIFAGTAPTVTPTFKLAADADNLYLLLVIEDDDHYPSWVTGGNSYEYDKVEVYFDVNATLNDAKGPSAAASGHYQFAPAYAEAGYGVPAVTATDAVCYELDGEGVVYEASFAYGRFSNSDAVVMDYAGLKALSDGEGIGFDITVVDRDEATNTRDRMVWANTNDGGLGESWTNMDECGVIRLPVLSSKNLAVTSMKAYPNPAVDNVTISADFNQVVISNVIGQQVKSMAVSSKTINISDLSKGVYVIKAYKNDKYVGTAKVTKN